MVGAPGYSSGRSVLVVTASPKSVVRAAEVAVVWDVFEKSGVLTTFASLDLCSFSVANREDGAILPEDALNRLEASAECIVSRARLLSESVLEVVASVADNSSAVICCHRVTASRRIISASITAILQQQRQTHQREGFISFLA